MYRVTALENTTFQDRIKFQKRELKLCTDIKGHNC